MFGFTKTSLQGVWEIRPHFATDERGGFIKSFDREAFLNAGIDFSPLESIVITSKKNVLRGVHFQKEKPQSGVFFCLNGAVYAVVVDMRESSGTYRKWTSVNINQNNGVYIPAGCAFGTLAIDDSYIFCMYGDNIHDGELSAGVLWNEPLIGIDWPLDKLSDEPYISEKDLSWSPINEVPCDTRRNIYEW